MWVIIKMPLSDEVTRIRLCDGDGKDIEEAVQKHLDSYIRGSFPKASLTLQERVVDTMILRHKWVLYCRSQYGNNTSWAELSPVQPLGRSPSIEPTHASPQPPSVGRRKLQSNHQEQEYFFPAMTSRSLVPVAPAAMYEDLSGYYPPLPIGAIFSKYHQLKPPRDEKKHLTIPSAGQSGSSHNPVTADGDISNKDWNEVIEAVQEVLCPFCVHSIPSRDACDKKTWMYVISHFFKALDCMPLKLTHSLCRKHVNGDLDPYICLMEECTTPLELYRGREHWQEHMQKHPSARRWWCGNKAHRQAKSENEFIEHMRTVHKKEGSDHELVGMAHPAKKVAAANFLFTSCPLCTKSLRGFAMMKHIIHHLRRLAFVSLPGYEDQGLDATYSEATERANSTSDEETELMTCSNHSERDLTPTAPAQDAAVQNGQDLMPSQDGLGRKRSGQSTGGERKDKSTGPQQHDRWASTSPPSLDSGSETEKEQGGTAIDDREGDGPHARVEPGQIGRGGLLNVQVPESHERRKSPRLKRQRVDEK